MYFRDKSRERLESETSISLDPQKTCTISGSTVAIFSAAPITDVSFKTVLSGKWNPTTNPVDPLASPISVQYSEGYTQACREKREVMGRVFSACYLRA